MIKKILSLIMSLVLVFFATSCQQVSKTPESETLQEQNIIDKNVGGCYQVGYSPTYEEVKTNIGLISEQNFDCGRFILFDCFEEAYEVKYGFAKVVNSKESPTSIEEFFNGSRTSVLSWKAVILLDGYCPDADGCYYGSGSSNDNHRLCMNIEARAIEDRPEVFDPELLIVEKQFVFEGVLNQVYYSFLYDGATILGVEACQELNDDILDGIRNAILDAYTD